MVLKEVLANFWKSERRKDMTLNKVDAGGEYRIVACNAPHKTRNKLETLGLVPGERINVLQSNDSGLIIEVKHSRLAIAHDLAGSLIVS
jgi:Fe2+ transport system protein FeoA